MNFNNRSHQKEQLDNLSLNGKPLHKTLNNLRRINALFGNHKQLSTATLKYCKTNPQSQPFHILDLGCGGGDCIYKIYDKLKYQKIEAVFTGIDGNKESIGFAKSKYKNNPNIQFICQDILSPEFELPACDILISSHFIYHFENQNLIKLLNKIHQSSISYIIISELYRSSFSYHLFNFFCYFLPFTSITKKDGLIAIKRSFTIEEISRIIKTSTLTRYKIQKRFWFRMLITINNKR